MRKQLNEWKHLVILGVLLSCFISKAQQITHQVTFNLNDVEINTVNGYEMVHLKSSGLAESENTAGEPQLPIVSVNLLLPEDAVATSVSITTTQETQITGSFTIYPVQLPAIPNFTEAPEFKVHDPVIYGSNDPFPQNLLVDFSTLGYRNYSIVEISYVPFRYLPLSGQLYLQNNITISVSYTVSPNEEPYQKRSAGEAGKMAWQYVTSLVANYSEAESFYPEAENDPEFDVLFDNIFETTDLPSLEGSRVEYVIITNDTDIHGNNVGGLTDIFQGFADWKTQMGMPAKVVTVDAIRSAYPGVDVQEKIRKFIQEAHQLWGTEYVLLGGNASIVPVRWVKHSFEMPTDLYYSAIYHPTLGYNDNWNANGNNIFGQNTLNNAAPDFADYMPDIAVGRAPISTEAEAELFLNKNFTYANSSGAWLGKTLLGYGGAFNYNWNSSCALRIAHDIVQEHYTNTNLHAIFEYVEDRANYPMNDPASWCRAYYNPFYMYGNNVCTENSVVIFDEKMTHPNMLAQISAGYGIINVLDHAGPYSMGIGSITHLPALTMNDFQDLSTTDKYGIFLAGGCHTAAIERSSYIGEKWVNSPGSGVSFFGASADIYVSPSYAFAGQFYNTIFNDGIHKQGWIHNYTSVNSQVSETNKVYLLKIYQLLGDPELTVFTAAPAPLTVSHPNTITNGQQEFTVNVSGYASGNTARVSVYKEGEVLAVKDTDDFPVTLDITPDTIGDLHVTVTSHNRQLYEEDIPVTQIAGTHLYIDSFTFTDENANGIIEPGEIIEISFELKNTGATGATNVSAVLSTNNINTVITQSTSTYPDIPSGQSGNPVVNYTFKASTEQNIRALTFALDITSSQGTFIEPILLPLISSRLNIGDRVALVDDVDTNEFNPYDEIELSVNIHNTGATDAEGVTAQLTTELTSNILSISTSTSSYGNIESGSYNTNVTPFVLIVGQDYTNQQLLVTLTLTDVFGNTFDFPIDLTEDFPPLISNFNFISSDVEIISSWNPANPPINGYNVYRSDVADGIYEKVNDYLVTGSSLYSDLDVEPMSEYWYKISVVSRSGNERDLDDLQAYLAYTTLRRHEGFPIQANTSAARKAHSSPTVYDIDGDGKKELFVNYTHEYQQNIETKGRIMGFYENGDELFDIDGNATEIWGFAGTLLPLRSNSAIGDIDNDGQAEVFAIGRDPGILYGFRTVDNNSDNKPDLLWGDGEISLGHRTYRNPVLADLDDDGYLEIIVMDERQKIMIYDKDKNLLGAKQLGSTDWALGEVAVADIDNDGYKEIIIGCRAVSGNKGAIYVWNHDGNYTTNPVLLKEFGDHERADSGMVLADIDNDGKYDILTIVKNSQTGIGKVYALNVENGTPVNSNWNGTTTITLSNAQYQEHIIPRIAVGDLNNDGNLEVVFGSNNNLYAMDNLGNMLPGFPINVGNLWDSSPILADVDDDDDIEIIVNANGTLKAFNYDGSACIGWNILPDSGDGFAGTPFIGDIDNNGTNEVVISSDDATLYVWDTVGDSEKVEWGSYRANAQNTGVYREECTYLTNKSIEINFGSVLWDENKHIQGDLLIKSGTNLTIKSKITFTKKGKIVVEPGGMLVVDGGILTTGCGGLWEGIQVLGNKNLVQNPANQGVLEIINGGVIEYAKTGVKVGSADDLFMSLSGGLLKIDDAVFKDNLIGVRMYPYPLTNNSYIKNSVFRNTEVITEGSNKKVFITIQGISSLYIKDNTFITEEPLPFASPATVSYWGKGITATDSRINANDNHFENLYSAIQVQGTGIVMMMSSSIINANTFENNWNAVYLNSIYGVKILSNDINVFAAYVDGVGLESPSGLYINNSNGFHIENNDFYRTNEETYSTGIFIRDCKAANVIYRNRFTGLFNAIHAYGQNTVQSGSIKEIIEGLRFVCNEFESDATTAIYIAMNSSISNYQIGDNNYSSGNIFTPECTGNFSEFCNNSSQVNYFTENVPAKVPSCSQNVNIFYTLLSNECVSTLPVLVPGLFAEIEDLENDINDNKILLASLTDGGDTEFLNTAIEEEEEALVLRDILLYESPFLSDTIMVKTALVEDALPSVMVKEILVANPKAAKSSKIQDALDNRSDQLPVYMREEIDLGKEILSEKEELEKVLSATIHRRENLIDRLIGELIEESLPASIDSLEALLVRESLKRLSRSYQLIDFYMSKGEPASAQTVYNNIPNVFDLSVKQVSEYNSFGQLFNIKYDLVSSGKTWYDINSGQESTINTLAADSTSISGMQSRAILSLINGTDYGFPIPLPVEPKNSNMSGDDLVPGTFNVFPRVADRYFIVEYVLSDNERTEGAEIVIFDSNNKQMKELRVKSRADQILIESGSWKEGVYICKKIINGMVISEEKVIIDRGNLSYNEKEIEKVFSIYPVPATDYFYLICNYCDGASVQISNVSGVILSNSRIEGEISKIETSYWSSGVYFVSIIKNNKIIETRKITVSH